MHIAPRHPAAPLDQAHGLRRLFAGRLPQVLALVANPHVAFSAGVLDRLAALLAAQGRGVLVVDAASTSPPPHEMAALDLSLCIEPLAPRVGYLAARGLPRQFVDTRGCAGRLIDALQAAAPQAEVTLLHADASDLARIFKHRPTRPLLLGADHPESIKHAYAGCKLLAQRCALLSFDLLLAASPRSPRLAAIARSLADCAESFVGATLVHQACIDPAGAPEAPADEALSALLDHQLRQDPTVAAPSWSAPVARVAAPAQKSATSLPCVPQRAAASAPNRPVMR